MSSTFKDDFLKPFLVLVIICIVASALLAATNAMTADVIAANEKAAMEATRREVLPGSESFEEIATEEIAGVDSICKESTGLGYVITARSKGYGGDVVVTVGIDANGQIVGVKANVSTETQGVGTKAAKAEYLAQYMGDPANAENAELITSATFSSTAVKTSVNAAIAAYNTACKEAQ